MGQYDKTFFITGGAGFIGSALIRYLLKFTKYRVINFDKLTYAGNLSSIGDEHCSDRHIFIRGDICDFEFLEVVLQKYQPHVVMHLAAESHVDRSIEDSVAFLQTNVLGTHSLLQACRNYFNALSSERQEMFRFHHVSTDEVFGDLADSGVLFTEETAYAPSSPYSASKASSDHLVRAWGRTYGLPVIVSNCSNNYGPYQFPEKLIPRVVLNAIQGDPLPIYGDGSQVRDWLYVDDHVEALMAIVTRGAVGSTYNVGGLNEKTNLEVVEAICGLLEELSADKPGKIQRYSDLIKFVKDRPGHDVRYAIDATKLQSELGWQPIESFESGLKKTVEWYLNNPVWWKAVLSGEYRQGQSGGSNEPQL